MEKERERETERERKPLEEHTKDCAVLSKEYAKSANVMSNELTALPQCVGLGFSWPLQWNSAHQLHTRAPTAVLSWQHTKPSDGTGSKGEISWGNARVEVISIHRARGGYG